MIEIDHDYIGWAKIGELFGRLLAELGEVGSLWMYRDRGLIVNIAWEVKIGNRKWMSSQCFDVIAMSDVSSVQFVASITADRWKSGLEAAKREGPPITPPRQPATSS